MTSTARITGQYGACRAEFRLGKGRIVHGIKHHASLPNTDWVDHLYQNPHVSHRNFVQHVAFADLVAETAREDLKGVERDGLVKRHGFAAYDYHE